MSTDPYWRIRAEVSFEGEWFLQAPTAAAALKSLEHVDYDEPENILMLPSARVIGAIVETDEHGEPLVDDAVDPSLPEPIDFEALA